MSTTLRGCSSHLTLNFKLSTHSIHVLLYYCMLEIPIIMECSMVTIL